MKEKQFGDLTWICVNLDEKLDSEQLKTDLAIDEKIIAYASDVDELAHIDYHEKLERLILVYDAIHDKKIDNVYATTPITFILKEKRIIILHTNDNAYMIEQFAALFESEPIASVYDFVCAALVSISKNYFHILEGLNKELKDIRKKLRKKTTKDRLLTLSDIEMIMIGIRSSSKQNYLVLEQLKDSSLNCPFLTGDDDKLSAAKIEARQILEMSELTAQTLAQLSETYNNILNNQLNDTMKILTGLSILLATPDIITGFFGINVPLPEILTVYSWSWLLILGIILLFGLAVSRLLIWVLRRKS
ncbi:magnesium transporter CorA family protein [Streptococcus pantholopis]|uniref:Magnesium transporter n=1 Tax=Streptococcus pantholopis TaxID=1811193 RepID=A0A172Q5Y2_9STRE|nr:magnesium transporter CorA family protein [Streptococcus pantholopis]AND78860.1 hypothetical protein A0O21_01870 [Streptococcus pantholopis]